MNSGLNFLVVARQCEIAELEQLARTSDLVGVIARLIHALQKERGISNVFLASRGARFDAERQAQMAECMQVQTTVQAQLDALDTHAGHLRHGARLFSRIAFVLHALDDLPALRARIAVLAPTPEEATGTFTHLIAGLLGIVFEAADSATDPQISRALVALFHFMQGKEFAGQERALGATLFASGGIAPAQQQQWQHLIESQEHCLQVFQDFSDDALRATWTAAQPADLLAALERLRRVAASAQTMEPADPFDANANASAAWYDTATRRIDRMKTVEDELALRLRQLCEQRIAQTHAELHDQQAILATLQGRDATPGTATGESPALLGPQLERAVLGLVQAQSRRLQAMSDELETVRATLHERKLVERAKGLLMASRKLSEDEAHKMLRQTAMNQNKRLVEVAQSVLAMADYL